MISLFKGLVKKYKAHQRKKVIQALLKDAFILFLSLGFFTAGILLLWTATLKVPDFKAIEDRKVTNSTKIYDRTGEIVLYDLHEEVKQTKVLFSEISPNIKNATVAIEDAEFYNHIGVRPLSFLRATLANVTTGDFGQGGSTITQQVVKNTLLTKEKKISRKLKEWIIAIKLERVYSKDEILNLYLNEAPYGGNIYGIGQASLSFFGKHPKDISLPEAAYLAALPQRPTTLSPYGNHTDLLEDRKNLVLKRMRDLGYINNEEYQTAVDTKVAFLPRSTHSMKAPHFVTWVREQLAEIYGEKELEENGYKVITTLNYDFQVKAEESVIKYAEENETKFNAKNTGMVGIDPKTGEVLLMVGSRDYFDVEHDGNFNTTLSKNRQPGSSFKPFVYAAAFEKGYTPETIVFNLKTQFSTACDPWGNPIPGHVAEDCFTPKNYDGNYGGPVTLRNALAQSMNIPAVKLLYLTGIENSINTAKKMGITSLGSAKEYGLTLVLGSGGVSPLEMTSAYAVFANQGVKVSHQNILRIEDKDGNVVQNFKGTGERVLEQNVALQISDILSDNVARAPAFGDRSYLYFADRDVAVKTGTTNDYRDAWIIGYTPSFVLGTWVGNNDNSSMEKKVAGFIVAPMWNDVMQKIINTYPVESFTKPTITTTSQDKPVLRGIWQGGERYFIDKTSGLKATDRTPVELLEEKIVPNIHEILYWVDKNDPRGPQPQNPGNDSQYYLWEAPVSEWVKTQSGTSSETIIPLEYDNTHTPEKSPSVTIIQPTHLSRINRDVPYTINISYQNTYPITYVEYFINDVFVGKSDTQPHNMTFSPSQLNFLKEENTIKVIIHDSVLNTGSSTSVFKL